MERRVDINGERSIRPFSATVLAICAILAACQSRGPRPDSQGQALGLPLQADSLHREIDGKRLSDVQIVVRFKDGVDVELRDGKWSLKSDDETAAKPHVRKPGEVDPGLAARGVSLANETVQSHPGVAVKRLLDPVPSETMERLNRRLRERGEAMTTDFNLYFVLLLPSSNAAAVRTLVAQLSKNAAVERAYPQPIPQGADIPPLTSIDLRPDQNYIQPAPLGIDVPFARRFAGGRGEFVAITDIETGWHWDHEDLPGPSVWHGLDAADKEHGTAVAGILWAKEDGIGITGIAPRARAGWSSPIGASFPNFVYWPAAAILNAADHLRPGDVLLIEQHLPDISTGIACDVSNCNPSQCGFLPVEFYEPEFRAIQTVTALGVTVVEAGGNGSWNLDMMAQFNRSQRDSGAILVGASWGGGNLSPSCFTNFGARVDVHAWGGQVATLGYGGAFQSGGISPDPALRANGSDVRQWYTKSFGGTSSAAPIVAGAAALLQSIRIADSQIPLAPRDLRALLVASGTPQAAGNHIGPQPDLKRAIREIIPDRARFVSYSTGGVQPPPLQPGTPFSFGVTFRNIGSEEWTGEHTVAVRSDNSVSWNLVRAPVGSAAFPASPGDTTSATLNLVAPSTPGTYSLSVALDGPPVGGGRQQLAIGTPLTIVVAGGAGLLDNSDLAIRSFPGSLRIGSSGSVTLVATNTGTSTWNPNDFSVSLQRVQRIGLPRASVPLSTSVPPGQSVTVNFQIVCTGPGTGSFSAQMRGTRSGLFGQSPGATVVCQR